MSVSVSASWWRQINQSAIQKKTMNYSISWHNLKKDSHSIMKTVWAVSRQICSNRVHAKLYSKHCYQFFHSWIVSQRRAARPEIVLVGQVWKALPIAVPQDFLCTRLASVSIVVNRSLTRKSNSLLSQETVVTVNRRRSKLWIRIGIGRI